METANSQTPSEPHVPKVRHQDRSAAGKTGSVALHRTATLKGSDFRIIEYVTAGLRNKEIANLMGSKDVFVIRNRMRRIYDMLGFDNRVELALWWCSRHPGKLPKGE